MLLAGICQIYCNIGSVADYDSIADAEGLFHNNEVKFC